MLGPVAIVRADVKEEHISSIIRVTKIGELGTVTNTDSCHPDDRGDTFLRNVGS
jgi:hypothetical protein